MHEARLVPCRRRKITLQAHLYDQEAIQNKAQWKVKPRCPIHLIMLHLATKMLQTGQLQAECPINNEDVEVYVD